MTVAVKKILDRFDELSEPEKRDAAREILRRLPPEQILPLADDELTAAAEELFLELDRQEAAS